MGERNGGVKRPLCISPPPQGTCGRIRRFPLVSLVIRVVIRGSSGRRTFDLLTPTLAGSPLSRSIREVGQPPFHSNKAALNYCLHSASVLSLTTGIRGQSVLSIDVRRCRQRQSGKSAVWENQGPDGRGGCRARRRRKADAQTPVLGALRRAIGMLEAMGRDEFAAMPFLSATSTPCLRRVQLRAFGRSS